ncbi:hypothetical protein [Methylosinus sp. Ce-a6]|uniref:hypothetical protein n=1 Tax=Methylosinus sp. Ce-a6 TaxID=2172005 RepID=UPI00135AF09C|nr:hypothetical protein [Methylosinus sp. Ce-a6]
MTKSRSDERPTHKTALKFVGKSLRANRPEMEKDAVMISPMLRSAILAAAFLGASAALISTKAENSEAGDTALAASLKDVRLTLEAGLATSEREGKPISAKFELEDGKLQLSIYTATSDDLTEVVIDPRTGAIAKAEKITDDFDLVAAEVQKSVLTKATISLLAATEKTIAANPGYRTVSVTPKTADGHPSAEVRLLQGATFKNVIEKLD